MGSTEVRAVDERSDQIINVLQIWEIVSDIHIVLVDIDFAKGLRIMGHQFLNQFVALS